MYWKRDLRGRTGRIIETSVKISDVSREIQTKLFPVGQPAQNDDDDDITENAEFIIVIRFNSETAVPWKT